MGQIVQEREGNESEAIPRMANTTVCYACRARWVVEDSQTWDWTGGQGPDLGKCHANEFEF